MGLPARRRGQLTAFLAGAWTQHGIEVGAFARAFASPGLARRSFTRRRPGRARRRDADAAGQRGWQPFMANDADVRRERSAKTDRRTDSAWVARSARSKRTDSQPPRTYTTPARTPRKPHRIASRRS